MTSASPKEADESVTHPTGHQNICLCCVLSPLDTPNRSMQVPPSVFFFCGITKTSHKALSSDCKHHSIPRRMLQPCLTSHRLPFRDAHEILMYCWTFLNKLASTGRTNVWVWKK